MALWFEGTEIKVRLLYFLCILLVIMAIISAFSTFIIGFVICAGTILVAVCGALGARFNSPKLLFYFIVGLAALILLSLISIIITLISGWSWWLLKDFIIIAIYVGGIFLAFVLRGRTFRPDASGSSSQNSNFQKL